MNQAINALPISDAEKKELAAQLDDPARAIYLQEELVRSYREFQAMESQQSKKINVPQAFERILSTLKDFYVQLGIVRKKQRSLKEKVQRKLDERMIADINKEIDAIEEHHQ